MVRHDRIVVQQAEKIGLMRYVMGDGFVVWISCLIDFIRGGHSHRIGEHFVTLSSTGFGDNDAGLRLTIVSFHIVPQFLQWTINDQK